jgi:cell division protein FtsB
LAPLWFPAVTVLVLAYFGFHTFHGQYGLGAEVRLERERERLTSELEEVREEREALETRAARLRPQSLDLDFIDELARQKLNVIRSDEVILRGPDSP